CRNGEEGIILATANAMTLHRNIDIKSNTIYNNCLTGGSAGLLVKSTDNVNILNNTFYDDQTTKTQTIPIYIDADVTDYYIDGNDFGQDLQSKFYSANGKIGDNKGLSNVAHGKATFADG